MRNEQWGEIGGLLFFEKRANSHIGTQNEDSTGWPQICLLEVLQSALMEAQTASISGQFGRRDMCRGLVAASNIALLH